jgi:hypothetical protein
MGGVSGVRSSAGRYALARLSPSNKPELSLGEAISACRLNEWSVVHVPGEGVRPCRADDPGAYVDLDRYAFSQRVTGTDLHGHDGTA